MQQKISFITHIFRLSIYKAAAFFWKIQFYPERDIYLYLIRLLWLASKVIFNMEVFMQDHYETVITFVFIIRECYIEKYIQVSNKAIYPKSKIVLIYIDYYIIIISNRIIKTDFY